MPTDDELFKRTLPAFTKHIQNRADDLSEEFRKKVFKAIRSQERMAAITYRTSAGRVERVVDRALFRHRFYRSYAQQIGEDFLSAFSSIIKPYCGMISISSRTALFLKLIELYRLVVASETDALRRIAASMGRSEQSEGMILPMSSLYGSTNSKYQKRLDEEIEKHNLEMSSRRDDRSARTKVRPSKVSDTPKHEIIKAGVARMLESLRSETPATTLEKAKRVYAHNEGMTYANVNKMYHYKPKK